MQRGQEISEEDTSNEDGAIAREEFLQDLIQETRKQIDLRNPLVCDSINLCELFAANKLDQTLKKLKISTLKSMCFFFGADISGPATRKAIYQCHLWSTEVLPVSHFSIRIERLFIPSRPCKMSCYLLILVLACDTSILGSEQQVKYHLTVLTIVKCCQWIIQYHRYTGNFFMGCGESLSHNYNTRLSSRMTYALPKTRTNYGIFNIRYQGAKIWNAISDNIKLLSLKHF